MKDSLLAAAFGSGKQKGPKKGEGSGDTQHGELANAEQPKKVSKTKGARAGEKAGKAKPTADGGDFDLSRNGAEGKVSTKMPRQMKHETGKVLPSDNYSLSRNGAKGQMESPADKVTTSAHRSKMRATERWIEGDMDSDKHDAVHRRANSVLRAAKRGR
jgi:hypothetical protein